MIRRGDAQDVAVPARHAPARVLRPLGRSDDDDLPLSRYVEGWGRPGDSSLILIEDFHPVAAAWYRLFGADEPGYGFVDEQTPELTVAVVPSRRGRGYGDELLAALLEDARGAGFGAISLSVEPDNPALHLYERHGFTRVGERGGALVMRAESVRPARPVRSDRSAHPVARGRASPAAPRPTAEQPQGHRHAARAGRGSASSSTATPRITPISLGGSGPERAKVKKIATMTAAAAKITRPEWATPADHGLARICDRSKCSFAAESRKTV